MSRIGRRLGAGSSAEIPRYIKHPAGSSANSWLQATDPFDAGTAHIIDNNLSHLSAECARHLVWDHTVGATAATDGWDANYSDSPNAAGGSNALPWVIAWDHRTARCYPIPAMIADRDLPEGGLGLREIRVQVYADVNNINTLKIFAAITSTESPPTEGALALATAYGTVEATTAEPSSGLLRIQVIVRAELPAGPPQEEWEQYAGGNGNNAASVPVHAGFLWVGWHSTDAANEIQSISAYEVPGPITVAPNEAGGQLVWYRADSVATADDAYYSAVLRLLDLSGNERHADFAGGTEAGYGQGVGTVQLTTDGSAPMMYFAGGQYACPHESALNPSTFTMFFLWTPDSGSFAGTWLSLFNKSDAATDRGFGIADRTHVDGTTASAYVDDEAVSFVDYTISANETALYWVTYDGSTLRFYRNNISVGTVAKVGYVTSSAPLVVGGKYGDYGNQGFYGAWGECGLYDRVLTNAERNDLWYNYFKVRYKL